MTQEIKNKLNNILTTITKLLNTGLLVTILFVGGRWVERVNARAFDTIEEKVNTQTFIKDLPRKEVMKDLINHVKNDTPYGLRDTVYATKEEVRELIKKQAIDAYNNKRDVKKVLSSQEDIKATLKAIEYKLAQLENN